MLASCNASVYDASVAIEPFYVACMLDRAPPEPLALEGMTDDEIENCNPLDALCQLDSTQTERGEIVSGSDFGDEDFSVSDT